MEEAAYHRHDISDVFWKKIASTAWSHGNTCVTGRDNRKFINIDEPAFEWLMFNSSYIKVHQDGTGARGGNQTMSSTKG